MDYTIKEFKENPTPTDEVVKELFCDWFCKDSSLPRRGRICLQRLKSLVKANPDRFDDKDTISIKNCQPGWANSTYDCLRIFDKDDKFKFCFVHKETDGGCSYMDKDRNITNFKNWKSLKDLFKYTRPTD